EKDPLEQWSEDLSLALPDDLAERLSLEQQLDRALAQLPPMQAAVLLAHKRDGLSYEETAEKLGISVHTVEKYLTKAKARMRALLWER
ncbi:MAG TPA: sigma-70 region 4 domain-containing protein, partial [Steroidobacter sp.]